jgi:hypothetical protein
MVSRKNILGKSERGKRRTEPAIDYQFLYVISGDPGQVGEGKKEGGRNDGTVIHIIC